MLDFSEPNFPAYKTGKISELICERFFSKDHAHINLPTWNLMEACKPLAEYAWLIDRIRLYLKTMKIENALRRAIDEVPEDFVLKTFLMINKSEASTMLLTEYNEEKVMGLFKEDGRKEGRKEGIDVINDLNKRLAESGRIDDIVKAASDQKYQEQLLKEFGIG